MFAVFPLGAIASLPVPAETPLSCATVELGRRLFFDTRLSRSGATSCATCHEPARGFTDGRAVAVGDRGAIGRRNAPTLLNRAYGRRQLLDGRAVTLEAQAVLPLTNPVELANTHEEIVRRLSGIPAYRRQFAAAFGDSAITVERLARAIASFERTLVAGNSPFDRMVARGDSGALDAVARRGFELARGKASCVVCHEPPLFTDERFHNTGMAWRDSVYADSGRFTVTGVRDEMGAFKTPTLRNVARTAPYMHDGSLAALADVIEFYDGGGRANRHLDPLLRPLRLAPDEKAALLAFLESLTDSPPSGGARPACSTGGRDQRGHPDALAHRPRPSPPR